MKKIAQYLLVPTVGTLTLFCQAAEEFNSDPDMTVATPAKMAQPIKDVPAAVSIIEGDTIRRLGFTNIPDILRLAPGFVTAQGNAWDYRVAYHGTNNFNTRRMQVLVDGMSVYRSGLAKVDWLMLPVAIKDIERIEVTRDPSSASYGANAFQAVVNIITREANQPGQLSGSAQHSSRGVNQSYLRYEDKNQNTAFSVSAEHTRSDGFYLQQQQLLDRSAGVYVQNTEPYPADDGNEFTKLSLSGSYQIDADNSVQLAVGGVRSLEDNHRVAHYSQRTRPNSKATDNFMKLTVTSDSLVDHRIKFEANRYQTRYEREWVNCYPQFLLTTELRNLFDQNSDYADSLVLRGVIPSGGSAEDDAALALALQRYNALGANAQTPICGSVNQNYVDSKNTFELQDTWALSDTLRTVTGIGLAHNSTDSETFLGGTVEQNKRWIYTNIEWRPVDVLTLNAGTMLERDSINRATYNTPRLAAGYEFMPNQVVKYVVATSRRAPDLTETNLHWSYYVQDLESPIDGKTDARYYRHIETKNELVAERDYSHSLIWLGRAPTFGLNYEFKVFHEKLDKLISQNFGTTEHLSNDGEVRLRGAEYQLRYKIQPELTLLNTYAYLLNDANNQLETLLYARHSGSLALLADIGKYQYGFAYYGSNFENADSLDRFQFLVGRHYAGNRNNFYWQAKIDYLPNNTFSQIEAGLVRYVNRYRDETAATLEAGFDW